jgi:hypothetical protein
MLNTLHTACQAEQVLRADHATTYCAVQACLEIECCVFDNALCSMGGFVCDAGDELRADAGSFICSSNPCTPPMCCVPIPNVDTCASVNWVCGGQGFSAVTPAPNCPASGCTQAICCVRGGGGRRLLVAESDSSVNGEEKVAPVTQDSDTNDCVSVVATRRLLASDTVIQVAAAAYDAQAGQWKVTLTGLTGGTQYPVAIQAFSAVGASLTSSATLSTATEGATTPSAPGQVTLVSADYLSLTVTFAASASDGGSPINGYVLEASDAAAPALGFVAVGAASIAPPVGSVVVAGLSHSRDYTFRVKARNGIGDSAYTTGGAPLSTLAASPPAAPTGGAAAAGSVSATSFVVEWTPSVTATAPVVEYETQISMAGQAAWLPSPPAIVPQSATPGRQFASLFVFQNYDVRVRARNLAGFGGYFSFQVMTNDVLPAEVAPATVTVTALPTGTQLRVEWAPVASTSPIAVYEVALETPAGAPVSTQQVAGTLHTLTITSLASATFYVVRVRAQNQAGWSPFPQTSTSIKTLVAPAALSVATPDGKVRIAWQVDATDTFIEFSVEIDTPGWIALGVSDTPSMDLTDNVVAWVENPTLATSRSVVLDATSPADWYVRPETDAAYDLSVVDISETFVDGKSTTSLVFQRLLTPADTADDLPITGASMYLTWAYDDANDGSWDNTYRKHSATGSQLVNFLANTGSATPPALALVREPVSLQPSTGEPPPPVAGANNFAADLFRLAWQLLPDGVTMQFTMEADVSGWVSVGFSTSPTMADSDVFVGWVNASAGSGGVLLDMWSSGYDQPVLDEVANAGVGAQSHTLVESSEVNDAGTVTTRFVFTRPLVGADPLTDVTISKGVPLYVVYAYNLLTDGDATANTYPQHDTAGFAFIDMLSSATPSAPLSVAVTGVTQTSATVAWGLPSAEGAAGAVLSYDMQTAPGTLATATPMFAASVVVLAAACDGVAGAECTGVQLDLTTDTAYVFCVRAVNAGGTGLWSTAIEGRTNPSVTTPPDWTVVALPVLAAGAVPQTTVVISWLQPNLYGLSVLAYTVRVLSTAAAHVFDETYGAAQAVTLTIDALRSDITYEVTVTVTTGSGSAVSGIVSFATAAYLPCPNACSENGVCVKGSCQCESGWLKSNCSMAKTNSHYFPNAAAPVFTLHWAHDAAAETVNVMVQAKTLGWASLIVGWTTGGMTAGDTWLVSVDDATGALTVEDRWSDSQFAIPRLDDEVKAAGVLDKSGDLRDAVGYQTGTETIVSFERAYVTGKHGVDDRDIVATPTTIAWAIARNDEDEFTAQSKHGGDQRGKLADFYWFDTGVVVKSPPAAPLSAAGVRASPAAAGAGNYDLTVAWTPPVIDSAVQGDFTLFTLEKRNADGTWTVVSQATVPSATLINVAESETLTLRVRADTTLFEGAAAEFTVELPAQGAVAPPLPAPPTATDVQPKQQTVQWAGIDLAGVQLVKYNLQLEDDE